MGLDEEWIIIIVTGIQGILATVCNFLVIISMIKFEKLRTCTNVLIWSLSVVDLMSGLTEFPVSLSLKLFWPNAASQNQGSNGTLSHPPKGWEITCKMKVSTSMAFSFGNLMAIFCISLERFICIQYPMKYTRTVTKGKVSFGIAVKWTLLCFFGVISLLLMEKLKFPCGTSLISESFINGFFVPSVVVFLLISLILYLKISCTAYEQSKVIISRNKPPVRHEPSGSQVPVRVTESSLRKRTLSSERKIAKVVGLVMGVYCLSYVPLCIIAMVSRKEKDASPALLSTLVQLEWFT